MMDLFQRVFLSQWIVLAVLVVAFLFVSRWSLFKLHEYAGYALGWMIGLFFILVYASLGGGRGDLALSADATLNIFQVLLATLLGAIFGGFVVVGLRFGMRYARGVALQVAFYNGLMLILLFLVIIEGPVTQRMVGIFALAFGITTVFAAVLFPTQQRHQQIQAMSAQSAPQQFPQQYPQQGMPQYPQQGMPQYPQQINPNQQPPVQGSRLDSIRRKMGGQ